MKPVPKKALQAFKLWGRAGGERRAKTLSRSARRAIAQNAAQARWGKQKATGSSLPSVRLEGALWDDPVYLEEILSHGSLKDWRTLRRKIADHPFGAEAIALEKVLNATRIYGITSLWKGILGNVRGYFS